ncbi:hypothetical protein C1H46_042770 [Malus baccata]|uniref:Dephospho-CoA kinase n=1 Tax=Malus baccata TaxID=106549 RepID=A0A540KBR7_MALBA|nr:hypothetical protein C1H46_042770 [Malus baccata]
MHSSSNWQVPRVRPVLAPSISPCANSTAPLLFKFPAPSGHRPVRRRLGSSLRRPIFKGQATRHPVGRIEVRKSHTTTGFKRFFKDQLLTERAERMRIVGLTGGIASGKSTVSNLFKEHGIPVVDADLVARDVLKKGTGGWKKVVSAFGEDILQPDGQVDRPKLGQIVFSNPEKRQLLNRLLAPYISSGIFWEILKLWMKGCKVIVLDVPLLFEAKMDKWTKPIVVVWVDPETQLRRLMSRDRTSEEDAGNRINAQMSLDIKRTRADMVVDNSGSLEDLRVQFRNVLLEVTKPLTWTEFGLSRQGASSVFVSIVVGVLIFKKVL